MLNIVISFDYELFLGRNFYDDERVLFGPTKEILKILKKNNVTATFFADVCSVFQHEKYGLIDYCNQFSRQLKDIELSGCDVQLHVHPNWLKSQPKNGQWIFDENSYRIHYFDSKDNEEWTMATIIKEGKEYLEKVLGDIENYKCVAYRAGGFAIQPHQSLFPALAENGIKIDSSIVVKDYLKKDIIGYDFRKTPKKLNWMISNKDLFQEEQKEIDKSLFEVPVMTIRNNIVERTFLPKYKRIFRRGEPLGKPISIGGAQPRFVEGKLKRLALYNFSRRRLSFDEMNYEYLFRKIMKIYGLYGAKERDIYIAIIGHPKAFSGDAFENLEKFVKLASKEKDKIKLVNMRDIYDSICMAKVE